jgi:hypothetical protein
MVLRLDSVVYDEDFGCLVSVTDTETGTSVIGVDPALPKAR